MRRDLPLRTDALWRRRKTIEMRDLTPPRFHIIFVSSLVGVPPILATRCSYKIAECFEIQGTVILSRRTQKLCQCSSHVVALSFHMYFSESEDWRERLKVKKIRSNLEYHQIKVVIMMKMVTLQIGLNYIILQPVTFL